MKMVPGSELRGSLAVMTDRLSRLMQSGSAVHCAYRVHTADYSVHLASLCLEGGPGSDNPGPRTGRPIRATTQVGLGCGVGGGGRQQRWRKCAAARKA